MTLWDTEQRSIDAAPAALGDRLAGWPGFHLGLRGFDLGPLSAPRA